MGIGYRVMLLQGKPNTKAIKRHYVMNDSITSYNQFKSISRRLLVEKYDSLYPSNAERKLDKEYKNKFLKKTKEKDLKNFVQENVLSKQEADFIFHFMDVFLDENKSIKNTG